MFGLGLNKVAQVVWAQQCGTRLLYYASQWTFQEASSVNSQCRTWNLTQVCLPFCSIKLDKSYRFNPAKCKDKYNKGNYSAGLLAMINSVLLLMMSMAKLALTEVARN